MCVNNFLRLRLNAVAISSHHKSNTRTNNANDVSNAVLIFAIND